MVPAGRVGRPHGLDGSFHVTRPVPALLDEERIRHWLDRGAQPSTTVKKLLKTQGIAR